MSNEVILPWPPTELNPNSRVHWTKKSQAVRRYRKQAFALALQAGMFGVTKDMAVHVEFCPPSRGRFDVDNRLASIKSGIDGIADAIKIDDSAFKTYVLTMGKPVKGGEVRVRVVCVEGLA
ncbi:crossover junction endodeoxyribonuclease RusA [Azomonas agilis]|uniref:Crossover junction endodeoxyribonuclease RusA n=1 Tax=Azomonas agilis TaxID=116849 RepID=A0A562HZM9_9GAMM|nr:endodeoxyribonuclease RusA [Azomonas agilis]TWH63878.1 crossover junction endodeoxyribonuclease RusA [Azomonas agilis]